MINKQRIGEYLKNLRKSKGYTQEELSIVFLKDYGTSISINAIAEWEGGRSLPSPDNLDILSDIYDKSIDEILDGEDIIDIDYKKIYFIYKSNWGSEYSDDKSIDLYQMRNEQIKLIVERFKELVLTRIDRELTISEEKEFKFLFDNFYSLTDYAYEYSDLEVNDEYFILKDAISEILVEIRNMSKEEKYWEIQKLFTEDKELWFSFWSDTYDLNGVKILQERFKNIELWQKDMLLAMFQNIEPWDRQPDKYGSNMLKEYERVHGEYNHEKIVKSGIREYIKRGACLNRLFFCVKRKKVEEKRIIDRLEYLYNKCLKPIEIGIYKDGENEYYKIENNAKNRFLSEYYYKFKYTFNRTVHEEKNFDDVEEMYSFLKNNDEVTEDIYLKIAKNYGIDTNQDKKYWILDVKRQSFIDDHFKEYKDSEKEIEDGKKEIKKLEKMLLNGEKNYNVYSYDVFGGDKEADIRKYVDFLRINLDYSEYLKGRDKKATDNLLKDLDKLSLREIRDKYFKMEVIEDE